MQAGILPQVKHDPEQPTTFSVLHRGQRTSLLTKPQFGHVGLSAIVAPHLETNERKPTHHQAAEKEGEPNRRGEYAEKIKCTSVF